jgi:hypothetical protein
MLVDRFHLAFHMEKKLLSVYTLTVAKTGMKLTKSLNQDTLARLGLRGLMGLKPEAVKARADVMVVDRVEKPSEN